jgi:hypothetical protein
MVTFHIVPGRPFREPRRQTAGSPRAAFTRSESPMHVFRSITETVDGSRSEGSIGAIIRSDIPRYPRIDDSDCLHSGPNGLETVP